MSVAYYEAIIRDCENKINEIETSIDNINAIYPYLNEVKDEVSKTKTFFENIIIDKKKYGQDELGIVSNDLENAKNNLDLMIVECYTMRTEYITKKHEAESAKAALLAQIEESMNAAMSLDEKQYF